MKAKQEQIEEMAKIIREADAITCGNCDKCRYSWHDDCDSIMKATNLYKQGYRKLPKDSVVLSREEYEKLEEKIMDLRLDKQELKNEISEKDNKIALLEETIECIKFNVDFTRKETAREIAEMLKAAKGVVKVHFEAYDELIENIAEKYGVDLEDEE